MDVLNQVAVAGVECYATLIIELWFAVVQDVNVGDDDVVHGLGVISVAMSPNNNRMCYICPEA